MPIVEPKEQKIIPLNMMFRNLRTDEAFVRVQNYVNKLIEKAKDEYFEIEDKNEDDPILKDKRKEIRHYKELWKKVDVFITNSSRD